MLEDFSKTQLSMKDPFINEDSEKDSIVYTDSDADDEKLADVIKFQD